MELCLQIIWIVFWILCSLCHNIKQIMIIWLSIKDYWKRDDNNNNTIKMYYIAEKHRTTCIYYEKAACTYQRPSASRVPLSLWSALGGYITAFDIEFQSSSLPSYYLGTMLDRVIQSSTNSLEHITIKGGNVRDYGYDI